MIEKIFRLGKETAVYGLSTVVGRLLNFLIVPFYANVLLPAENGIISNMYAYIAFITVLFTYGMEPAYMRFVSSLEKGDKKQNFSVPFLSLLVTSVLFAAIIHWNASALCGWIGVDRSYFHLIQYSGWILCFDALSVIPFASLRMDQKAKKFASLKVMNISINLILNLVLILGIGMHAEGVFLANLIASAVTFVVMLGVVFNNFTVQLSSGLYKALLKFGLPYIPAGLAGIAMQVIDRPIVKALTNDATLGIYQINYRLGIFMMLIVGMFDYAWRPFFLHHAKEPDAKKLFAKVFTYYVLGAMCIFLPVSFFIGDLVRDAHFRQTIFSAGLLVGCFNCSLGLVGVCFYRSIHGVCRWCVFRKENKIFAISHWCGCRIECRRKFFIDSAYRNPWRRAFDVIKLHRYGKRHVYCIAKILLCEI